MFYFRLSCHYPPYSRWRTEAEYDRVKFSIVFREVSRGTKSAGSSMIKRGVKVLCGSELFDYTFRLHLRAQWFILDIISKRFRTSDRQPAVVQSTLVSM